MINHKEILATIGSTGLNFKGVYLFGSQANGSARPNSDIDIAVLQHKGFTSMELWDLYNAFVPFDIKVDIVDLFKANIIMQNEITSLGTLIFTNDQYYCDVFENKTKTMYEDFTIMSKDLYDGIIKTKSVYG